MSNSKSAHKLLVVGGNGYVGSHVCQEAVNRGHTVISLSRRGQPPPYLQNPNTTETWHKSVQWQSGDILDPSGNTYKNILKDVTAVISCVGGFGSVEQMKKINGDANVNLARISSQYKNIKKFVYVSAKHYTLPEFLKQGYYAGKFKAEKGVKQYFPTNHVILRPGAVYGTRYTNSSSPKPIPLWIVFQPLEFILRSTPVSILSNTVIGQYASLLLTPPINVKDLAKTAVDAATTENIKGILEDADIYNIAHHIHGQ